MRLVSQDGTRDFPYECVGVLLRHRYLNGDDIFVIVVIYEGKEYDMGYFHDSDIALEIMESLRTTPEYFPFINTDECDDDDKSVLEIEQDIEDRRIMYFKIPTEESLYE